MLGLSQSLVSRSSISFKLKYFQDKVESIMATANPTDSPQPSPSENDNNKESESSEEKEDSEANRAFEV